MARRASDTTTPTTLSGALAQKIRELLRLKKWSQREFAQQLGASQSAVSYLLGGERRGRALDFYERLAAVFGMPLSVLFQDLEARVSAGRRRAPRRDIADGVGMDTPIELKEAFMSPRARTGTPAVGLPSGVDLEASFREINTAFVRFLTEQYSALREQVLRDTAAERAAPRRRPMQRRTRRRASGKRRR